MHKWIFATIIFVNSTFGAQVTQSIECSSPPSFASYLWRSMIDIYWKKNPAAQQEPFTFPKRLPSTQEMANELQQKLGKDSTRFLLGASTSEHQSSKNCTPEYCSFSKYCQDRNLPQPSDHEYKMNLWQHYKEYIDYAADELKLNSLRFSIEWALVQPTDPDSWDNQSLAHYADLFIYAIKKGVTPLICFHHYTDPNWFLYKKGGFEHQQNAIYFKHFCTKIYATFLKALINNNDAQLAYERLGLREPLFATFNSPEGYAFKGYREMTTPPSDPEKKGLDWAIRVLRNMMHAHVEVYYALKEEHKNYCGKGLPNCVGAPQIGLLKNIHQLDPANTSWLQWFCSPITRLICIVGNMVQNESIYQFFTNGVFKCHVPGLIDEKDENARAIGALDWIGLNYYSNRKMFLAQVVEILDPSITTANSRYTIYPHGMYRAIAEVNSRLAKPLGIPLYITENGFAAAGNETIENDNAENELVKKGNSTEDDKKRSLFYSLYLYAIMQAAKDGYPVKGYLPWTLFDNYEWFSGKGKEGRRVYGLCAVDEKDPAKLLKKQGSKSYFDFVAQFAKKGQ